MSRKSRRFVPSVLNSSLESRKLLDGSGLPSVPGLPANPPPTFPGESNIIPTPPPGYDPLAPVFVTPSRPGDVINMDDGTNAAYSVE